MSVVERGTARCPRCMAQSDYTFEEGDGGFLYYQVACSPCSYVYVEDCRTSTAHFTAA